MHIRHMKLSKQYVNIYRLQKKWIWTYQYLLNITWLEHIYTHRCVYFHTANKEMTKTEIHPDHSIMTKIKSFNTKLKENPKIHSFRKNTQKIPNVWICLQVYVLYLHTLQIMMKIQIKTLHLKEYINWII